MKSYNRSNITEEPIIDADQSWKLRYLDQLRESRETGKPLSEVINADRHPADHIRVQNQIKKIIDADQSWKLRYLDQLKESRETGKPLSEVIAESEQRHRFKLRDQK